LFKAKRLDNGEWVEGDLIREQDVFGNIKHRIYQIKGSGRFQKYDVDAETISQYTGLTDKNGKKIWENDVVRYIDEIINKEKVDRICFNETHAAFTRLHKTEMGLQYLYINEGIANNCEVLGNIFDNPKLLRGE